MEGAPTCRHLPVFVGDAWGLIRASGVLASGNGVAWRKRGERIQAGRLAAEGRRELLVNSEGPRVCPRSRRMLAVVFAGRRPRPRNRAGPRPVRGRTRAAATPTVPSSRSSRPGSELGQAAFTSALRQDLQRESHATIAPTDHLGERQGTSSYRNSQPVSPGHRHHAAPLSPYSALLEGISLPAASFGLCGSRL